MKITIILKNQAITKVLYRKSDGKQIHNSGRINSYKLKGYSGRYKKITIILEK